MAFRVGQKVVCIKRGAWSPILYGETCPAYGEVYTVRGFDEHHPDSIYLFEIVNPPLQYAEGFYEASWYGGRFRAVVERKTDISIFTAMLNPSKQTVDAR